MSVEWLVSFCVSLTILGLWFVCRYLQRSWIGPGGMLCAVWFFGTLLPLCFAAYFPVNPAAYLLILLFVVLGVVGSSLPMLFINGAPRQNELAIEPVESKFENRKSKILHRVYWASLLVGSLTPAALFVTLVSQFGTTDLLELAAKVTVARYSGDFSQPLFISILTMILFFSSLLGGLLAGLSDSRFLNKLKYMAWILPLLVCSMMQTTKASALFGGGLFGAALVTGMVMRGRERQVRLSRLLTSISAICGVAFLFVYAGLLMRYGAFASEQAENSIPKATIYFVGHMGVLGSWVKDGGVNRPAVSGGTYTFGGLFELAGIHDREQGLFDEMVEFGDGGTSNIYTAFRSCIEDFTLPGALLFFTALSFAGGVGWAGLLKGKIGAGFCFLAYLSYLFLSPITSVFVYNTNVGALALLGLTLWGLTLLPARKSPKLRLLHEIG